MFKPTRYIALALGLSTATIAQDQEPNCEAIQGVDAVETKQLQTECFDLNLAWFESRTRFLTARKKYLEAQKDIALAERATAKALAPEEPKQIVEKTAPVIEPTWPEFLYATNDEDGVPAAVLVNPDNNTIRVSVGDQLVDGARVVALFEKGIEVSWNARRILIGSRS